MASPPIRSAGSPQRSGGSPRPPAPAAPQERSGTVRQRATGSGYGRATYTVLGGARAASAPSRAQRQRPAASVQRPAQPAAAEGQSDDRSSRLICEVSLSSIASRRPCHTAQS